MNAIIQNSLKNSYSYKEYRALMQAYAAEGKTTGESTEAHVYYTHLNEARMHRLDKSLQLSPEVALQLEELQQDLIWIVLAETWCGDAAQVVPILDKMAAHTPKIEMHVVLRDEHPELMDLFLTNGTRSIPKLIIVDKISGAVLGDFGPRPIGAKQLIIDYKAAHGVVDETAKTALQKWYLNDKGMSTQHEIMELLKVAVV
jgi:hypothetical protein